MHKMTYLISILLFVFSQQTKALESCIPGEASESAQLIKTQHAIIYMAPDLCQPLSIEGFDTTMTSSSHAYSLNWSKQHHNLWHVTHYEVRIEGATVNTYQADIALPLSLDLNGVINHSNPAVFEIRACASLSNTQEISCSEWQTTTTQCQSTCTNTNLTSPFLNVPAGVNTTGDYSISWNNEGFSRYELEQEVSRAWATVYTGSELNHDVINQKNNATYDYRIRGCYNNVCSDYSPRKTVTVDLQIPEFNSLESPNLSGNYTVSWQPVSYDASVERYKLKERVNGGQWTTPSNIDSLSFSFTGKANGVYDYKVKACRANENCSDFSPIQQVIVGSTPPAAPSSFDVYQDLEVNTRYLVWDQSNANNNLEIVSYLIKGYAQNGALIFERQVAADLLFPFVTNQLEVVRYSVSACTAFQCGEAIEDNVFATGLGRVTDAHVVWDTENLVQGDFTYEVKFKYPDALFNDPTGVAKPDWFIITADFIQPEGTPQSYAVQVAGNSTNAGFWSSGFIPRNHYIGNNFTIKACNSFMGCAASVSINLGNPLIDNDLPKPTLTVPTTAVVESGDDITISWDASIFDALIPGTETPLVDYIQITETQPVIASNHGYDVGISQRQEIVYYVDNSNTVTLNRIVKGNYDFVFKTCHRDRKQGDTCSTGMNSSSMQVVVIKPANQNGPAAPANLSLVEYTNASGAVLTNLAWDPVTTGEAPDYYNVFGPIGGHCATIAGGPQYILENSANNKFKVTLNDGSRVDMISGVRSCPEMFGSNPGGPDWGVQACYNGLGCGGYAYLELDGNVPIGTLDYTQPTRQLRSTGGPGDMKPGVWWNPKLSGTGWHFYWASELRYPSVHENYGNTYDLIGVWLTYRLMGEEWSPVWMLAQMKQTQGDQDCTPGVSADCAQFFEGDLQYVTRAGGVTSAQSLGRLQVFFDVVEGDNTKAMLKLDIDSDNGILTQTTSINQGTNCNANVDFDCLSIDEHGNLNMPISNFEDSIIGVINIGTEGNDIDHYSGMWWGKNNDGSLNEDFGYLVDIQKSLEWATLIFYDNNGDPIWALSDSCPNGNCVATNAGSTSNTYRVVKTGFNPLLYTPNDFWSQQENLAVVDGPGGNGRIFDAVDASGFREAKMWSDIKISSANLPGRGSAASLKLGLASNPIDLFKVASLHDIRFFINGRDEGETTCDPNIENQCAIEFTWFTDDDFPSIEPYYSKDGGIYQKLSDLCLGVPLDNYVTIRFQCFIDEPGTYKFQLHKDQYVTTTGETIAIAESEELNILPCRNAESCAVQTITEVADAPVKHISSQVIHEEGAGPIPGSGGVSGGAATYNFPLSVAPGRNGMTPSISVNYSSKGGNGTLGLGWSVSAGSSIYRCPQTLAQDGGNHAVDFSNQDRLCLDGQRLMLKPGALGYFANGAEYRTEQDSFVKVMRDSASQFTVKTKSGRTNTYVQQQFGSSNQQTTWQLVKESDSFGNTIVYDYALYGMNEWLLDKISYTGHGNAPGDRIVAFNYADRQRGYTSKFLAGEKTESTQRLERIVISSPQGTHRTYDFSYVSDSDPSENLLLLDTVKETAQNDINSDRIVLNADWQGSESFNLVKPTDGDFAVAPIVMPPGSSSTAVVANANKNTQFSPEVINGTEGLSGITSLRIGSDINGDGNKEILAVTRDNGNNRFSLLSYNSSGALKGQIELVSNNVDINPFTLVNGAGNADFNGDGITDMLVFPVSDNEDYRIAAWKGTELPVTQPGSTPTPVNINDHFRFIETGVPKKVGAELNINMTAVDINNDGFQDLVYTRLVDRSQCFGNGNLCENKVYYKRNLGLSACLTGVKPCTRNPIFESGETEIAEIDYSSFSSSASDSVSVRDFNGDGYADLVITNGLEGLRSIQFFDGLEQVGNTEIFTFSTRSVANLGLLESNTTSLRYTYNHFTDLNGDGLEDFLFLKDPDGTNPAQWFYQLNTGDLSAGLFTEKLPLGVGGVSERLPTTKAQCNLTEFGGNGNGVISDDKCAPMRSQGLVFADVNSDGINDILLPNPDDVLIDVCMTADIVVIGTNVVLFDSSNKDHFNEQRHTSTICSSVPEFDPLNPPPNAPSPYELFDFYAHKGVFSEFDNSVYGHHAFIIEPVSTSTGIKVELNEAGTELPTIYKKIGKNITTGDFFGDGDQDYANRLVCPYVGNGTAPGGSLVCDATVIKFNENDLPEANAVLEQYAQQNYQQSFVQAESQIRDNIVIAQGEQGTGEFFLTRNDSVVSGLVASVTKPNHNLVTEWQYQPLSTDRDDRPDGTTFPLYSVPGRLDPNSDSYVEEDFAAGEHFYFNSSMYVVSEMRQTNNYGGNTLNEYAYEEAVYNNQGRGFQGFRKIKVRSNPDESDVSLRYETVSESTFHQVFPLAGKLESVKITKKDANLNDVVVGEERYCYAGQNYVEQPFSCETTATSFDGIPDIVYHPLIHKNSINRELNGGAQASAMNMRLVYDDFGNVTEQSDTTITYDILNGGNLRSETTVTSNAYYPADEVNWWVDRLERTTVEKQSPGNPINHVTYSQFFWKPYTVTPKRALDCQFTYINPIGHPASCATGTTNSDISKNSFIYDGFGNITEVATTATQNLDNHIGIRTVKTDYSAFQGYFPNRITKVNTVGYDQNTDFEYDINTGQITELIQADGNFVISTYDAYGFKRKEELHNSTSPGNSGDGFSPVMHTAVRDCYTACFKEQNIVQAVRNLATHNELISGAPLLRYYSEQRQDGQPLVKTWYDSANNAVLTQTWHSDSGIEGQSNSNYVVNITSPLGINVISTQPFATTVTASTTFPTISIADGQGRIVEKIITTGGLNSNMMATCTINTAYEHTGTHTRILAGNLDSSCATPGPKARDNILDMARVYDVTDKLLSTTDALNYTVYYRYDASGNPSHLVDAAGNTIVTTYDALGRKTRVVDPNMGIKAFNYNGFGEVVEERYEHEAYSTFYAYDQLGRIERQYSNVRNNRLPFAGVRSYQDFYQYDSLVIGQLTSVIRQSNLPDNVCGSNCFAEHYRKEFDYDDSNRVSSEKTILFKAIGQQEDVPDAIYTTEYRYDGYYNRLKQVIYDSAYSVENRYTDYHGALSHQIEAVTGQELMRIDDWNFRGQEISRVFNDNASMASEADYYPSTGQIAEIRNRSAGNGLERLTYQYDMWGNILEQGLNRSSVSSDFNAIATEIFSYDKLHRLTDSSGLGVTGKSYEYDPLGLGNIVKKSDFSDRYIYGSYIPELLCVRDYTGVDLDSTPGPNAVTEANNLVGLGSTIFYNYDRRGNRVLDCINGLEKATYQYDYNNLLVESSSEIAGSQQTLSFNYGADNQRYRKYDAVNNEITLYANKDYEQIFDAATGQIQEFKYYLTSYLTITRDAQNRTRANFMQTDRLGSTTQILDELGEVLHTKSYDAFGKPRKGDWSDNDGGLFNAKLKFDAASIDNKGAVVVDEDAIDISKRGFTNHEHLDEMQLIHMNGRMYDYNNGRFLSVDPFIQAPTSTQSMNPYTYIFNNPLSGTDPSGYYAEGLIFNHHVEKFGLEFARDLQHATPSVSGEDFALAVLATALVVVEVIDAADTISDINFLKKGIKKAIFGDGVKTVLNSTKKALRNGIENIKIKSRKNDQISDKQGQGIIYERTNSKGECYIGQCKSPERFEARQKEHNNALGEEHDFKIVDRGEAGKDLDIKEHNKIQEKTGGVRAKDSDKVQNKKDPVGEKRREEFGLPEPKKLSGSDKKKGSNILKKHTKSGRRDAGLENKKNSD
ncbi:RHS repeat-associated core domain-containing protein [Marinicella sp. W31]|uniref:RHS repeat-associated core domain-containing protein n=1 Tax=Marinicella sp. W31 TaxID=3023713 RepID=UPI003757C9BF